MYLKYLKKIYFCIKINYIFTETLKRTIMLEKLQFKFADEIKRYGITKVEKVNGDVIITSIERIPWELYESIKIELA